MTGRTGAVIAVALLAVLGMALPVAAQTVFCIGAVDVVPPPADMTNPLLEIRVIEMNVGDSSTQTFPVNGAVVGGTRGRFLFTGTVRFTDATHVEIGLTGVAAPPATTLAAYRAIMQFDTATGANVYNDNLSPAPFATDQMIMSVTSGSCPP
jgi:hypothetical protein